MFPDDCLQSVIANPDEWWIKDESYELSRGSLVVTFSPHVDQKPYQFEPVGRTNAQEHDKAEVKVTPLKIDLPLKKVDLPVAAMPLHNNEVWAAYRAKKRPCLVFSTEGISVPKGDKQGKANHATAPTFLAAPFYGVNQKETRAGYSPQFVERVRHCEYSQFHWDILPGNRGEESILRLGLIQPFGTDYHSFKHTGYKLSEEAISVMDDMLRWYLWGGVPEESVILAYREILEAF